MHKNLNRRGGAAMVDLPAALLLRAERRIVGHWQKQRALSLTGWYLPLLAGGKSGLLHSAGSRGERKLPNLVLLLSKKPVI